MSMLFRYLRKVTLEGKLNVNCIWRTYKSAGLTFKSLSRYRCVALDWGRPG